MKNIVTENNNLCPTYIECIFRSNNIWTSPLKNICLRCAKTYYVIINYQINLERKNVVNICVSEISDPQHLNVYNFFLICRVSFSKLQMCMAKFEICVPNDFCVLCTGTLRTVDTPSKYCVPKGDKFHPHTSVDHSQLQFWTKTR